MAAPALFGRDHELALLHDLIDHAPECGGALVMRGAAGIGKSALLADAGQRARARGLLVLSTSGVQSEAHLPFAGLHQLLRPILGGIDALPAPQRAAIQAAFGLTDAAAPDLFLIALAALDLLAESAAQAPVLLLAEDAHWLDRPTADVLAFVARRLESEPIVLLAAIRDGFESPLLEVGLPELRLEGLDEASAGALLDARAPALASEVRGQLLQQAAGNPLALVELPAALTSEGAAVGAMLPVWLPLTTRLERAFATRVSELPAATRALLLVAAADDGRDLAEVLGAAAVILGTPLLPVEVLEPAIAAGLLDTDERELRFRHPLMRSAIYQAAGVAQRRTAHAALAAVLADQPDRGVWHQAAAAIGPDEAMAAALEAAAERAHRRGAIVVAVAAFERAAKLSVEPAGHARRLLTGADLAIQLGRYESATRLIQEAATMDLAPPERRRLATLQEMIGGSGLADHGQVRALVTLAQEALAAGDVDVALTFLWLAASRCYWVDPGWETRALVIATAERLPVPEDDARLLATFAYAAPIERGAVVIERLSRGGVDGVDVPEARLLFTALGTVGDYERAAQMCVRVIGSMRAQGRLALLGRALTVQAWLSLHMADPDGAAPAAHEAVRLGRETGDHVWVATARAAEAMLAALRGEQEVAEACAAEIEQVVLPLGINALLADLQIVRGVAALTAGRYADAYAHLRRLFDRADPAFHSMERFDGIAYFVDAAVHSGNREEARALLHEVEEVPTLTPSPSIHQRLRYARPLMAADEDAEALFLEALQAEPPLWPFLRASLQLAYGEWLRRQRRVAESRAPLRAARDAFDAIGVIPWSERARRELRATGERSRGRTPAAREQLTPQELQIAQLAADGLTNREIGQLLFLSPRTVSTHLYRIFPKLGITSRSELRAALDAEAGAPA